MSKPRHKRWADPPPDYLEHVTEVRVRFQECDGLQIVWHGHYVSYLEDGRDAFGRTYGLTYLDVREEGYVVPLVHLDLNYLKPARFGDVLTVSTRLHPEQAARITFSYVIRDSEGKTLATGRTVQAFTDTDGTLVLTRPAFYTAWLERWAEKLQTG